MPTYKVETADSPRVFVKADSLSQLIEISIIKLKLDAQKNYKIVLTSDGTVIDSDDILLELAQNEKTYVCLKILDLDDNQIKEKPNENILRDITTNENSAGTSTEDESINCTIDKDFDVHVWDKISPEIKKACDDNEELSSTDHKILTGKIADYLLEVVKNTKRSKAKEIATVLCKKYPNTFSEKVGNKTWSDGINTLQLQIYNAILYRKSKKAGAEQARKRRVQVDDSDDEDEENRSKSESLAEIQDEYGCVDFAPVLPSSETKASQEEKRLLIFELLNSETSEAQLLELLDATYPTVRGLLNAKSRNLVQIMIDWPHLTIPTYLMRHAEKLLGKDVLKTWTSSLEIKVPIIRRFFKQASNTKNKRERFDKLIEEYKQAVEANKNVKPKIVTIFLMLILHFEENEEDLFKVIQNSEDVEAAGSAYPLVIIQGASLFDHNAHFYVTFNDIGLIKCEDFLEGVLISFLCYYIFGLTYNPSIAKTLEFTQRVLLEINPKTGSKNTKKKRRINEYDSSVYKLSKKLSTFSNLFIANE